MTYEQFLENAWNEHAENAWVVAKNLREAVSVYHDPAQAEGLASLVVHIYGQHLGQWDEGLDILAQLESRAPEDNAVKRAHCALQIASGRSPFMAELPLSDQVQAQALASSVLAEQGGSARALSLLQHALFLADQGLSEKDPAIRSLAIANQNMAESLREKSERTPSEDELMIKAAESAAKYWQIIGAWLQQERVENLVAKCYLLTGRLELARAHADLSLKICKANLARPIEMFWAFEINARVASAESSADRLDFFIKKMRECLVRMMSEERNICAPAFLSIEEEAIQRSSVQDINYH